MEETEMLDREVPQEAMLITRAASVAPASLDQADRSFDVVWTTGSRVARYSWARDEEFDEELVVEPSAIRVGRLNAGAPFLDSHRGSSLNSVLGVVVEGSIRIEGGRGYARIRMSQRDEVDPIWRDIKGGIIRNVSVGYRVHRYERTAKADRTDGGDRALYRAIDWEPMEISAVAIGADPAAGVRGAEAGQQLPEIIERGNPMNMTTAPAEPGTTPTPASVAPDIRALYARHNLPGSEAEAIIARGATLTEARAAVLDQLEARSNLLGPVSYPILTGPAPSGGAGQIGRAMEMAILHRLDPKAHTAPEGPGREFVGMTVPELAAAWCRAHDVSYTGGPARALDAALGTRARSAVGYHSTDDFPAILANVANLRIAAEYAAAMSALKLISAERPFNDFREMTVARLSGSVELEKTLESGEFTYGKLDDAGEKVALGTYGKILAVTRQALVNDAEAAFTRVTRILGTGAAETEAKLLVALFEEESGAGPTLSDSNPVFHASRGNIGTAAVISEASLGEGIKLLRRQRGIGGEVIAVTPAFLVVPPELEMVALKAVAETTPASTDDVNPIGGRLGVLVEPRFTSTQRWYLAAAPGMPEALIHGYLRGARGPVIETRNGFEVDGMEVKARIDFAAGFTDWRGLIMNPGAAPQN